MAVPAAFVVLPLGLLFLLSGLVVNLIQAVLFITVRPFSKNIYRRINRVVAEMLWIQLVWLVDWWAGVKQINESFQCINPIYILAIFGIFIGKFINLIF